jgi:hypothetical protein
MSSYGSHECAPCGPSTLEALETDLRAARSPSSVTTKVRVSDVLKREGET